MRSSVRFATVTVLVLSLGLHWAVLQTIAWTGMIVSYSRAASLSEAVSKTFDGQHPCPICKVIKQGQDDEKQQQQKQVKPGSKVELGLVWQSAAFDFSEDRQAIPSPDTKATTRSYSPPRPPPRMA